MHEAHICRSRGGKLTLGNKRSELINTLTKSAGEIGFKDSVFRKIDLRGVKGRWRRQRTEEPKQRPELVLHHQRVAMPATCRD